MYNNNNQRLGTKPRIRFESYGEVITYVFHRYLKRAIEGARLTAEGSSFHSFGVPT